MEKNKPNYLFVYGSLMKGLQTPMSQLLNDTSKFLGEGKMPGVMYDLGYYPGAVYQKNSDAYIYGHIFELYNMKTIISQLDKYESVGERYNQFNEYKRSLIPVQFKQLIIESWVYLYNLSTVNLPIIESGNYLENLKTNQKHRDFLKSV